jgi:NSS family neurotransmitter:Na+ symporter
VTASIRDKWGLSHRKVNLIVGGTAFLLGLPMLTGAGLYILDIVDHFMNSVALVLVVLGQLIIVGWVVSAEKMRAYINGNSTMRIGWWWNTSVRWIIPMGMFWMLASELQARVVSAYGNFGLRSQDFLLGWLVVLILPVAGDMLASRKGVWKD